VYLAEGTQEAQDDSDPPMLHTPSAESDSDCLWGGAAESDSEDPVGSPVYLVPSLAQLASSVVASLLVEQSLHRQKFQNNSECSVEQTFENLRIDASTAATLNHTSLAASCLLSSSTAPSCPRLTWLQMPNQVSIHCQ
jgi:hypothetical protein